ncbi:MAG: molybdopterin cofactor-binding domain-containing protein [Gammaproteobacteria bacterium]
MNGLSPSLQKNSDLDDWLVICTDGRVIVRTGKVELGQRISTALAIIAAEELDVDPARIEVQAADTRTAPDEHYTAGSMSLEHSGTAIRQMAAQARQLLLQKAAQALSIPVSELDVNDGRICQAGGGSGISYWELQGGQPFKVKVNGQARTKSPHRYRLIGRAAEPRNIKELITGRARFLHDMDLPGMVHGRVVRPPGYHARLKEVKLDKVRHLSGVLQVVRDGHFLGVIAEREEQAVKAARSLTRHARWYNGLELPAEDLAMQLTVNPRHSFQVVDGIAVTGELPAKVSGEQTVTTLRARYFRPYHMHGSIGPSAAIASLERGVLSVWTHSQGVYPLRAAIAEVLQMAIEAVGVIHVPGPGCYGHNGADDAALDAALLARALPGRPVMLKWEREDEHGWEPYGSAMVVDLSADLNARGRIAAWNHDTYSDTHMGRPSGPGGGSNLLAARHIENATPAQVKKPRMAYHAGIHRNADPLYQFPRRRIVKHLVADLPLRVSANRSLGAYANVFAIESFMDELAEAAGEDPLAFRLAHLDDERACAVLQTAAQHGCWRQPLEEGRGRGLAFARYKNEKAYAAVVMEVTVDDYGAIKLDRAVIAADAGQIVDADGLRSQLEGGLLQSASWTLKEQVCFDPDGVTSLDWKRYPILTFAEVPDVETVLIDQPHEPFLGAGEAAQGPTAAAIANAVYIAIGLRLRNIPFTPERVRQVAAG